MMIMEIQIKELRASIANKEILKGINLTIKQGEFHVIMGPNGSGKSTLAKAIMGYPKLKIDSGDILVDGKSILGLTTDKRAELGLFLQFQNPVEVEGVGFLNFLHNVKRKSEKKDVDIAQFMKEVNETASTLKMPNGIVGRSLNHGFSGGEKKKAEILQMQVLKPKIALLDEPDSGLDVDAIRVVAASINRIFEEQKLGMLVITHYNRILSYMKPDFVHVLVNGKIVAEGNSALIKEVEENGYDSFMK